ncbi:MAG: 23S rRNA (pseudouridine(1915)-N(3))-methyltransferase RlmH [Firmicutes bacterium]|nr:23S rRNA (pseudouridine(1915)-N(3))-methyltransferase RlmH [Bacillota bacterium]
MVAAMRLLTVGKPRSGHLLALAAEYQKRLGPVMPVAWDAVGQEPPKGAVEDTLEKEGQRLLARIGANDWAVVLDVAGDLISSLELAERLDAWRQHGRAVTLIVGGPLGLSAAVRQRANWRWSLSPLTFPHDLVPVLVLEQLYRAWSILQHHPYHK